MNSDNYDYNQSPRVRQIPITVESRDGPRSRASGNTNNNSNNAHHNHSHSDQHQQNYSTNKRPQSHNPSYTSTVKIETKPEQTTRNTKSATRQKEPRNQPTDNESYAPMEVNETQTYSGMNQHEDLGHSDTIKGNADQQQQSQGSDTSDAREADPKTPIPMPPPPPSHEEECPAEDDRPKPSDAEIEKIASKLNSVKRQAIDLVRIIEKFEYTSSDTKEFRYIEEMLTRCVLELDQLECSQLPELRQQRKDLVRCVEQASKVLHKKVELNASLSDLFTKMKS